LKALDPTASIVYKKKSVVFVVCMLDYILQVTKEENISVLMNILIATHSHDGTFVCYGTQLYSTVAIIAPFPIS